LQQNLVVDFAALSAVAGGQGNLSDEALGHLVLGYQIGQINSLPLIGPELWNKAAGVLPAHIRTLAGIGSTTEFGTTVAIWRLDSANRQTQVIDHLLQIGFKKAGEDMLYRDSMRIRVRLAKWREEDSGSGHEAARFSGR
jgi:hypothetical protein